MYVYIYIHTITYIHIHIAYRRFSVAYKFPFIGSERYSITRPKPVNSNEYVFFLESIWTVTRRVVVQGEGKEGGAGMMPGGMCLFIFIFNGYSISEP